MAERKIPLKTAVNEALRAGLEKTADVKRPKFKVEPQSLGFKPGIDRNRLNQLVDELEVEDFVRKMARDNS